MTWFPRPFRPRLAVLVAALLAASTSVVAAQTGDGAGPGASLILKRIAERGEISIGHREASEPYSFVNAQQQVEGYSIDMCLPVVEAVKKRLNRPDLKIKYVPINTTNRIALVANGTIDLECGTTTNFLIRQEQVEFSPIFYVTGTQVLVKASADIAEFENLRGQRVAVLQASSNEAAARRLNDEEKLGIRFVYARDLAEGALLVETDRVDAFLADGGQIKIFAATKAQPAGSLKVVGRLLTYDPYSAMMQRGDQDFALLVRRAFAETFRTGAAEKLFDKWFGPLGIKLDEDLRAAFRVQAIPDTL